VLCVEGPFSWTSTPYNRGLAMFNPIANFGGGVKHAHFARQGRLASSRRQCQCPPVVSVIEDGCDGSDHTACPNLRLESKTRRVKQVASANSERDLSCGRVKMQRRNLSVTRPLADGHAARMSTRHTYRMIRYCLYFTRKFVF
jgi:hypothetical protein